MATTIESDEATFAPASYKLDVPSLDGHRAARCALRFSGNAPLDRTSADDVELMSAARLGNEVLLLVRGRVATKAYGLKALKDGDELEYAFTVQVTAVEAAETA